MALTNEQITAQNFKDFYGQIRPYLNGAAHSGFTPVGTVISVMGKTAPLNYLACDGSVVNIADYSELAAYFAGQFEASNFFGGDGVTTFAVPDLRGEFLRGTGTNGHTDQGDGASVGTHQDGTGIPNFGVSTGEISAYPHATNGAYLENVDKYHGNTSSAIKANKSGGWSGTYNTHGTVRPTNTSVLYCIATKNIFMDAGMNFSTEEQVVGTWFDGSLLYRRCYELSASFIQSALNGDAIELTGIAKSTCAVKRYEYEIYRTNDYAVYRGDMNNFASSPSDSWSSYGSPSQGGSFSNWQFYLKLGSSYDGACKGGIVIVEYTKTT